MSAKSPLKVVLYWHMHQPEYRDMRTGLYHLPWTYLHAIKDYVDMAEHIHSIPEARAVINFAPVLLDQINDYSEQISDYLNKNTLIRDPLLSALAEPVLPVSGESRIELIKNCLRANEKRMIHRYPSFQKIVELANYVMEHKSAIHYLSDQMLVDILVWYHLAWVGETVRRKDLRIKQLLKKESGYTHHDRILLVTVIGEICSGLIGQYRSLVESGQIELSMSPYAHPIVPLMLDINSAQEAMPDVALPALSVYPGGEERVHWHLRKGIETFEKYFGYKPQGCWPSEGGVSDATLKLLSEYGFRWTATGETVLTNSLNNHENHLSEAAQLQRTHTPYRLDGTNINCFFRDDGLSDLIGFTYSDWHADDAVANLVHHLGNIAQACKNDHDTVVSIILDGENAWEYYFENGYYFLNALYDTLGKHPDIELTTFSECLASGITPKPLSHIVAGSWVYGTFSTWIGDPDKNRAWDMLGEAKLVYDLTIASGKFTEQQLQELEQQLAICEGSDWFWWFGDYNPAQSVSSFEHLFRLNLSNLYSLLGKDAPYYLAETFTHGSKAPVADGVMRPGQERA